MISTIGYLLSPLASNLCANINYKSLIQYKSFLLAYKKLSKEFLTSFGFPSLTIYDLGKKCSKISYCIYLFSIFFNLLFNATKIFFYYYLKYIVYDSGGVYGTSTFLLLVVFWFNF